MIAIRNIALIAGIAAVLFTCAARTTLDREFIDPQTRVIPTGLTYSANPAVYVQGAAITANRPTLATGAATSYSILPALPAGLTIDAATGEISGTATVAQVATNHTVTAKNDAGQTSAVVSIEVRASPELIVDTDIITTGTQSTALSFAALAQNQTRQITINISNPASAGVAFAWSASESYSYLSVSPTTGTVNPNSNVNIVVTVDTTGLANGNYSGNLNITSSTAGTVNAVQNPGFSFSVNAQIFVAVGESGKIWRSVDGDNWTSVTSPIATTLCSVAFDGTRFVVVGLNSKSAYSTDATASSFTLSNPASGSNHMYDLATNRTGQLVAAGGAFTFGVSPLATKCGVSGTTARNGWATSNIVSGWPAPGTPGSEAYPWSGAAYGNGMYVMVNFSDAWAYSTDGTSWTQQSAEIESGASGWVFFDVAGNNSGRFVAVGTTSLTGESGGIFTTTNATTNANWASGSVSSVYYVFVENGNNQWVAGGYNSKIHYSTNGTSWTAKNLTGLGVVRAAAYGNGRWVVAGDSGFVRYSTDITSVAWITPSGTVPDTTVHGLAFGP